MQRRTSVVIDSVQQDGCFRFRSRDEREASVAYWMVGNVSLGMAWLTVRRTIEMTEMLLPPA